MAVSCYPNEPVVLIDDEASILKSFELTLKTSGINHIESHRTPEKAIGALAEGNAWVVLLDLGMPGVSGEELLGKIRDAHPEIPVIIITGDDTVDTAVRCMQRGAFDYIVKPVEKSRLVSSVRRAIEIRELQQENRLLRQRMLDGTLSNPEAFSSIITNNRRMIALFQYAEAVALSPQPVLITGETGVGKELMAHALHTLSKRPGAIVSVNAAGIDDNVFADTLFGHVKGAFTGADQPRKGLIEKASGGTLVLDEIGDLNMDSQVKLLRLIQEQEYFPLGEDLPRKTDARIMVSTNLDLHALQKSGRFRKDLYYRLRAHHLHIPPLRERAEDIPLLLDHFLAEAADALQKPAPSYPPELLSLLRNYHFPGNIRELRTMLYDAVSVHTSRTLSLKTFQSHMDQERGAPIPAANDTSPDLLYADTPLPTLKQATRQLIREAMRRTDNNQSMAARLLGISRQTLARHLQDGNAS